METNTVTQTLSDKAAKAVETASAWASGWAALAAFLREQGSIAEGVTIHGKYALYYVSPEDDALALIERVVADSATAGLQVAQYLGDNYAGIQINFGPTYLQVYAEKGRVFARQVVGVIEDVQYAPLFSIPSQDGEEK